jgi:transposase
MAKPYSTDLRERVVSAVSNGETIRSAGERFGVAPSSVSKWSQLYRESGSLEPGKMGGHRPWLLAPHRAFIAERMQQTPHLTVSGLQQELAGRGVCVSRDTVWRYLRREGLSFKKKPARR